MNSEFWKFVVIFRSIIEGANCKCTKCTKILSYLIPIISFTIILTPIIDLIASKIIKNNSLLSSLLYALLIDDSNYSLLSSTLKVSNNPQSTTAKS